MKIALLFVSIAAATAVAASSERGIVGITVDRADFTRVTAVLQDSPAERAGVQAGDRIVAIDEFPTSNLRSMEELVGRVSGPVDSEVELELKHAEGEPLLRVRLLRMAPPRREPFTPPGDFRPDRARHHPAV